MASRQLIRHDRLTMSR